MNSKSTLTIPEEIGRFVREYERYIRPNLEKGDLNAAREILFPVFMRRGLFVDNSRTSHDVSQRISRIYRGALKYLERVYGENPDLIDTAIVPIILKHVDTRVGLLDNSLRNSGLYRLERDGLKSE